MPLDQINVRIDAKTKAQAEAVLSKIGLAPSDAIRTLYRQIIMKQGLPFPLQVEKSQSRISSKDIHVIAQDAIKKHKDVLKDLAGR